LSLLGRCATTQDTPSTFSSLIIFEIGSPFMSGWPVP
jgi:hypothetical protein